GADYAVTGAALAAAIRTEEPVDAVVTGMAALDGLGSVIGSLLAAELGWPQLSVARSVSWDDGVVTAHRGVDGVSEAWRAATPAVVSVTDVTNSPRLARMKEILAAKSKPVRTLSAADLGLSTEELTSRTVVRSASRRPEPDRKSTRLNSSHVSISYAVFCLKKKT